MAAVSNQDQKDQKTNTIDAPVANVQKNKKKKKDVDCMNLILPNLYVGGIVAYGFLQQYNIKCILNCAVEIKHEQDDIDEMQLVAYKHICIDDIVTENISNYIDDGMDFISDCVDTKKQNTLVHCMEGKSRSISMVLGYLMKHKKWSLLKAYKHCKKQRRKIRPNKAFWKSLMELELKLFNKNSVTMKTIPSGPKAHICPYCDKNCGTSSKFLANHVKRKHPNQNK